jgi:outer membrane protein assembly factor BamB
MNQCYTIPGPDNTTYFVSACRQSKGGKRVTDYRMYAISPDMKVKWQCPIKKGPRWLWHGAHVSSPAIAPDGTIYVGGSGNFSGLHAIKPDGTVKWTCKAKGRTLSSPAVSVPDKTVYVGCQQGGHPAVSKGITGHMLAVGFDGILKWSFPVGDEVASSPAIGKEGEVYFGSRDGYFYALDKGGKEKWKFRTGDCIHSSAAIDAEGKIYFGSHDYYIYCLSPKGKLLWKYLTGGSVVSSPAIGADGTVYVGSADGYLYAFDK